MGFNYRESVLTELERYGVFPTGETPPELVHEFVSDLYRFEIRALRTEMKAGLIPKTAYADRVRQLRDRYAVLSLPVQFWTI